MEDDKEYRDERRRDEDAGDRARERSRSRERGHRTHEDDRHRTRRDSHSRSRSRSPRRSRHRSHSRSRERDRVDRSDRHEESRPYRSDRRAMSPPRTFGGGRRGGAGGFRSFGGGEAEKSVGGPMNATPQEAEAHARVSKRGNRLYVGNLAYDCNYRDLEKFMQGAGGKVVFSEVLVTPAGQSKGCGIVEFETQDQARQAMANLADRPFMGRSVFIREDREESARFGATPVPGKIGMAMGEARTFPVVHAGGVPNRNLFVGNLPMQASWQDLKDLMRQAGEVIRADVGMTMDGRPKGNGTVVFIDPESARAAIQMFNGFDWYGSILEVREDRFANMPFRGRGGFRGGFAARGAFAPRGAFRGGFGGHMGMGGGHMGGMTGAMGGGGGGGMGMMGGMNGGGNGYGGANAYADYQSGDAGGEIAESMPQSTGLQPKPADPSQQILVRNLPWSTSNEDLVELFETVGNVTLAEIMYEGEQSRGEGIVQFTETEEAQLAAERFMGYLYGGRPIDVQFNPVWYEFSPTAAKGGQGMEIGAQ